MEVCMKNKMGKIAKKVESLGCVRVTVVGGCSCIGYHENGVLTIDVWTDCIALALFKEHKTLYANDKIYSIEELFECIDKLTL